MATIVPSVSWPGACWTLLVCCLLTPGAQEQEFLLRVEPQNPVFPAGGSLLVNCSTDCPSSKQIILETSLSKELVDNGTGWAAFQLSDVTGNSRILCSGYCNGSQITGFSDITVYSLPERVELAPLPSWQPVGQNLTLHCQVEGGSPRTSLTVVLLRREEELSRQPAVGEPAEVTATVPTSRKDHGAHFSCRTELDMKPQGLGVFRNTSAPRQLRTFALPVTPPRLLAPRFLEVEKSWQVNCILDGLFPASEARVYLALGDQMLNATVMNHGDMLTATATATARADQEGAREIVCVVILGGQRLEAREKLTVFSFLGPILNLSEPSAPEGSTVTVSCMAGARVQVTLDGVPAAAPGQPAQLHLNATESDDGRSFLCSATLEVDGEFLYRNSSVQLRVLYGPKIDRATCPQHLKWKDKTRHVLQCQARGNPYPQLRCLKEGSNREVPVGIPFFVNVTHNGTYQCQASSSRGKYTLVVVMDIEAPNSHSVPVVLAVLVTLGVVTVVVALIYVFREHKRSGRYHVREESTSLPLTSTQPTEAMGEEPSRAE
ncbi:PREDICTED: intercellular adhesion molecule 3 [Colobus angolensis palliatus]|uniref:Intercellular adhesion molecule 3 n=1 Tax=Colobus angolensis palliatus TaxID=336983 RepID=A0A2K5KH20_COLAP|nr:PREDICTED: intercellular adhesion molecule 3 [Colobus angolensis palliatus]